MSDTIDFQEFSKPEFKTGVKIIKEDRVNVKKPGRTLEEQTLLLDKQQKNLVSIYKNEKTVPIRVAPSYAKYFGRVMRVAINGIIVAVKCDGSTVNLPESFATEVSRRMSEMDKYENRLKGMSRYQNNFESSPGQLNLFG